MHHYLQRQLQDMMRCENWGAISGLKMLI